MSAETLLAYACIVVWLTVGAELFILWRRDHPRKGAHEA